MECGCSLESNEIGFGERWNDRAAQSQAAPARIVGEEEIEVEIDNYENGFIRLGVRIGIEWALSRQTAIVLPGNEYGITFGAHLQCKVKISNNNLEVVGAVNGWGDSVPLTDITIEKIKELNGIKEK
jgi:hypothetical protein